MKRLGRLKTVAGGCRRVEQGFNRVPNSCVSARNAAEQLRKDDKAYETVLLWNNVKRCGIVAKRCRRVEQRAEPLHKLVKMS